MVFSRAVAVAFPLSLLVALLTGPVQPVAASASPVAMPLPLRTMGLNHRNLVAAVRATHDDVIKPSPTSTRNFVYRPDVTESATLKAHTTKHTARSRPTRRQDTTSLTVLLAELTTQGGTMSTSSDNLRQLATQSASTSNDDASFQQNAAAQLTSFQTAFASFQGIFGQLAADKGLANYDKNDQLETQLKDVVNANKDALSATDVLVYNIPDLGPVLGPIVYEIKCIIDDILDALENVTDGLLNQLAPELEPSLNGILGRATTSACGMGIDVAGLCL